MNWIHCNQGMHAGRASHSRKSTWTQRRQAKGLSKASEATACAAETLYKEKKLSVMDICSFINICGIEMYRLLTTETN